MAIPLLGILGAVLGPVAELGKKWLERKQVEAQGRIDIEKAKTEGTVKRMIAQAEGDIEYDVTAAEGMASSWKDEWLTILLSLPVIMCFIPGGAKYVHDGFDALALTPEWFQYSFMGIIIASFGLSRFVMPFLQAKANAASAATSSVQKLVGQDAQQ